MNFANKTLKLTYFERPGRAFVARTCFGIGGIEFENEIISPADLDERRGEAGRSSKVPLGQLPVLTLPNGTVITQSFAISRYAAKLAKLYPEDPEEALLVDEIIDVDSDIINGIPRKGDAALLKTLREEFCAGKLNTYFSFLAEKLEASSGPFFTGSKFTVADLHVYLAIKVFRANTLDPIPADYDAQWPALGAFVNALESDPVFAPYKF